MSRFYYNTPENCLISKKAYLIGNRQENVKEDWKIVTVFHSNLR